MFSLSISESTQPTEPSPLHTNTLNGLKCLNNLNLSNKYLKKDILFGFKTKIVRFYYPGPGPLPMRSNTCAGFNICLNRLRNFIP